MKFPLNSVHFIGIGGIGMSAIAEMLPTFGVRVQGSNDIENANTRRLKQKGIPVFIGHDPKNIQSCDAVIISSAIHDDNVELKQAQQLGIPVGHRSEILSELLRFKRSICVSGTHGKTTTSSLIAHILMQSGLDPSYIIGGILTAQGSNAGVGTGDWVVAEADESDGSFLKLPSTISVVTNIEPEHLDYYKTFEREKMAYQTFLHQTAFYGVGVVCLDHPVVCEILPEIRGRSMITYGLSPVADVHAENIRFQKGQTVFDVIIRKNNQQQKLSDVQIPLMGKHNVLNSLAAIAVGHFIQIPLEKMKQALSNFQGIQRRLTLRGTVQGISVFDDYAHHPSEIRATLDALKNNISGRLVVVFQPHRYSRFQNLWADFMTSFNGVDALFVTDVYSAGDAPIPQVSADRFVSEMQQIQNNVFHITEETMPTQLASFVHSGDTIVCLNAGSLSKHIPKLLEALEKCP